MMRRVFLSVACTAAFTLAGLGASSAGKIDTFSSWDGSQYVYPFGCSDTTTYGQTFTAPRKAMMRKFTFWWTNLVGGNLGQMVVRGEVYAWDGTKATGSALWESRKRTISYNDSAFHAETFKTGTLPLTPGAQYVMFASIDKDYAQCTNSYELEWGLTSDSAYPGGTFVYLNSGGDETQWTTTSWSTYGGDLALIAVFR